MAARKKPASAGPNIVRYITPNRHPAEWAKVPFAEAEARIPVAERKIAMIDGKEVTLLRFCGVDDREQYVFYAWGNPTPILIPVSKETK